VNDHLAALKQQFDAALADVGASADTSRAAIDGDIEALHEIGTSAGRPPLIADVYPPAARAVGTRVDPGYAAGRDAGEPGVRRRRAALAELTAPFAAAA
jgi:hypothetical protein